MAATTPTAPSSRGSVRCTRPRQRTRTGPARVFLTPLLFLLLLLLLLLPGCGIPGGSYLRIGGEGRPEYAPSPLPLKEKAERWNTDKEIQTIVKEVNSEDNGVAKLTRKYSSANAKKLLAEPLDRVELAEVPLPYERLDQLTMEVLMGVR